MGSTTACPTNCECIEKNCESEITTCLADAACAAGQTCADACACGDKACLAGCAASHPSAKAVAVLTCATAHCQLGVSAMPDCSTTACPTNCECIEKNCESEITTCLADAACAAGQTCADAC